MTYILIIIGIIASLIILWELVSFHTYGTYINDDIVYRKLLETKSFTVNSFNPSIISFDNFGWVAFVSKCYGVTFKYYINGYGVVPRWSKSHKIIDGLYKKRLI